MSPVIQALVRHALQALGVYLVSMGILSEGAVQEVIGAILTIASVGWSVIDKQNLPKA